MGVALKARNWLSSVVAYDALRLCERPSNASRAALMVDQFI
jgi:hypothetical protein